MQQATEFLRAFVFDGGMLQLTIGHPEYGTPQFLPDAPTFTAPDDGIVRHDVFFGPAMRLTEGTEKVDVLGTVMLWVDADDPSRPVPTLPPTAVVMSGHGYHLYWQLAEPLLDVSYIEKLNKLLAVDIPTADKSCWNANRILRVPMTSNMKDPSEPITVELVEWHPDRVYTTNDVEVISNLPEKVRKRIQTGSQQGFRSRSERDWSVVKSLVGNGATDVLILAIFDGHKIGDKHQDVSTPSHYLERTIAKARESTITVKEPEPKKVRPKRDAPVLDIPTKSGDDEDGGDDEDEPKGKSTGAKGGGRGRVPLTIVEKDDGYYMVGNVVRRVSTFTLTPKVLLDGSVFGAKDALVCDVHASGHTWHDITFSRSAFTSTGSFDREAPVAEWQWIGSDNDVRLLLPFLLDKMREAGAPRIAATPVMGVHYVAGKPYFVGDSYTLSAHEAWSGTDAPIVWLPTNREHPVLHEDVGVEDYDLQHVRDLLPGVNEPAPTWIMIGWYAAACMKPWLEARNYRYPILNVAGTKGSGKTTLIQRIFMPLFGQQEPKSYDAGTTKFVQLALLGSSNDIPIAFSEFRYDAVEKFIRTILMSYDTGHDPRGKADQTTVDYPLSAPFSVDGEDIISDAAAQERIVLARLRPDTVAEGGMAYSTFQRLRASLPKGFGNAFVQRCLAAMEDGTAATMLKEAHDFMFESYPSKLPDRVRNNYTVVLFGTMMFCKFVGLPFISADVFRPSIGDVVNMESGRGRTQVDDFAESIINALGGVVPFKWDYDHATKVVYIQLTPAHSWWLRGRRQQGRGALEKDAIRTQLKESVYSTDSKVIDGTYMWGIDLTRAQEVGLDVPAFMNVREFRMKFPGDNNGRSASSKPDGRAQPLITDVRSKPNRN
jgi:hypothetical protein